MDTIRLDARATDSLPVEVRFGGQRNELEDAFRLVYRLYRQREYSQPHPARLRYVWHLGMPGSRTIIALTTGKQIVATTSYVPDGSLGLPMDSSFGAELEALRTAGKSIAEVMCLAIDVPRDKRVWELFYRLTRFLVQYACWQGTDELVIAVHPRHEPFYCRHLGFVRFGNCRPYWSAEGHPATACRLDLKQLVARQAVRPSILRMYFGQPIDEALFDHPDMPAADHEYFCRKMRWNPAIKPASMRGRRLRRPA